MLKCQDCNEKATHVFKAHKVLSKRGEQLSANPNIYLCEGCAQAATIATDNGIERNVPIRLQRKYEDGVMELWEKEWQAIDTYRSDGKLYYIYVPPNAKVYHME